MSTYLKLFALSLFVSLTLCSCGSDDEQSDSINDTTKATMIGDWRSVKSVIDGVDMTSSVFGTFSFSEDNTYSGFASEGGFGISIEGSYSVTEEGTLLSLFDNMASLGIAGNAEHRMSNVTESTLTLTFVSTNTDRVIDFVRN